jgi:hypothetical protein
MGHEVRERLHPGLERRAEILVAAPVEHDRARGVRVARELGGEPRLADSRARPRQRDLPIAAARRGEHGLELRALGARPTNVPRASSASRGRERDRRRPRVPPRSRAPRRARQSP